MTAQLEQQADDACVARRHPCSTNLNDRQLDRRAERRFAPWWWFTPALLALVLNHNAPSAIGAFFAFNNWKGIGKWQFVGWENAPAIAEGGPTTTALNNTFVIGISFEVMLNVIGLLLALGPNRPVKSRNIIRTLILAPVVLSSLATSYIWKFPLEQNGPLNEFLAAVGLEGLQKAGWVTRQPFCPPSSPSWAW